LGHQGKRWVDRREAHQALAQGQKHLDTKDNKKQQSALLMAVDSGLNNAVMEMLKKGADTKSKDSRKRTALHWAAVRRNVDVAR
jgi:ankyrin repeat protein